MLIGTISNGTVVGGEALQETADLTHSGPRGAGVLAAKCIVRAFRLLMGFTRGAGAALCFAVACLIATSPSHAYVFFENYRGSEGLASGSTPITPNYQNHADGTNATQMSNLRQFSQTASNIASTGTANTINWGYTTATPETENISGLCSYLAPYNVLPSCVGQWQGKVLYTLIKFPVAGTYSFAVAHDDGVDIDLSSQAVASAAAPGNYRSFNYNVPVGSLSSYTGGDTDFETVPGNFIVAQPNTCYAMRIYWNNQGGVNHLRLRWTRPSGSGTVTEIVPASALLDPTLSASYTNSPACVTAGFDVAVAKSGPTTFDSGPATPSTFNYTVKVWNKTSSTTPSGVVVYDTLPAGVSVVGTPTCVPSGNGANAASCGSISNTGNAYVLTTGNLPYNSSSGTPTTGGYLTYTFTVRPNSGVSTLTNTATLAQADLNLSNNDSTVVSNSLPLIRLSKSASSNPLVVGASSSYVLTVQNFGGTNASAAVTVTDPIPTGLTIGTLPTGCSRVPAGSQTVQCTVAAASLPAGGSFQITIPVVATAAIAGTTITNTATATGGGDSSCTSSGRCIASVSTPVNTPMSLTVTKSAPAIVMTSGNLAYSFTIGNTGQTSASVGQVVTIREQLPAGVTYVSAVAGTGVSAVSCTGTAPALVCSATLSAALPTNGSANFTLNTTAPSASGSITNYASVDPTGGTNPPAPGATCTPASSCTSASTTVNTPMSLTATKSAPATVVTSGNLAYSFTIGNTGQTSAPAGQVVTIREQLPAGVTYVSAAAGTGVSVVSCTGTAPALVCSVTLSAALPTNGSATFTLNTTAPSTSGSITNYASVDPTGGSNPPAPGATCTPASSCTSASTTVNTPMSLTATKSAPATVVTSGNLAYSFTIGNTGQTSAPAGQVVTIREQLPAGVTYVSAVAGTGVSAVSCTGTAPALVCSATLSAALPTNGTASFTLNTTAPGTSGSITNYASVDPTGGSNPPVPGAACSPASSCTSASTTVNTPMSLTATKTAPATVVTSSALAYSFTISNSGQTSAPAGQVVTIREQLPAGVTFVSAVAGTGVSTVSCTGTAPALVCAATLSAALPTNGTASFTLNTTAPSTSGSITNYASVDPTGGTNPPTPGATCSPASSCTSASTTVNTPMSLAATKSAPATVVTSGNLAYSFTISNTGQTSAPAGQVVTIREQLPAGVTYVSAVAGSGVATVSCTGTAPALVCSATLSAALPTNGTASFTLNTTAPGTSGSITNYASVDPTGGSNPPVPGATCTPASSCTSASTTVNTPMSLTATKSAPATVVTSGNLAYSFTIGNTGQTPAAVGQVVTINEQLPAGVTFVSAVVGTGVSAVSCTGTAPALVCSATLSAALPTNGSATFTLNTTAPSASGAITNYASVDPTGGTNPPAPGAACSPASSCTSASTTVNTPMSLTATKTAPATIVTGQGLAYSFTISNTGQTPAAVGQVVTINEQLPAGVAYVSAIPGSGVSAVSCTGTAPALVCSATLSAALPTNGSANFTLNTTAPTSSGSITNYASVDPTGGTNPPVPGAACSPASSCTSASTTVNTPMSLTATKTAPATVVTGSNLAYSFTISNTGQTPAAVGQVVTINEQLPAGVAYVSATPGSGVSAVSCTGTAPTLVCSATLSAALPTNGTATFTLNTTAPTSSGSITNYASVDPTGGTNPPAPGAACSPASSCTSASTTVNTPMSLTATKTAPATVVTSQGLAYSFTIGNTGQTSASVGQVVTIREQLPVGVTYVSAVAGTGVSAVSCTGTAPALVCSATLSAALPTNGTASFTLNTTAPSTSGSITNYASVDPTGGTNPPVPGAACTPASSCTSTSTTVNTPMSLTATKSAPTTVVTSGNLAYSFTISNTGQTSAPVGQVVTIREQLPAGVAYVSAVAGSGVSAVSCTGTAPALVCSVTLSAALPTNGTATFTLNTTAPSTSGSITNYASVDPTGGTNPPTPGATCSPASSCTSASTTVNTPMSLTATKSAPAIVVTSGNLAFSFTIGNTGQTSAPAGQVVTIREQLPAGVSYVSAVAGTGVSAVSCIGTAPALVCSATLSAALPTNGTATFTLNTTAPSASGSITNYASVDPTGGTNPPAPGATCTPASSCTSASTTVNTPMSLTATKSAPTTVVTSGNLAYSFTIGNTGQTSAPAGQVVTIREQLPAGVTYVSAVAGSGVSAVSCTGTAPALVCSATLSAALPTNGSATFTLNMTAPSTSGTIANYASVDPTGGTNPPAPGATCTPASSCTSASTTVNTPMSLTATKSAPATVVTSGNLAYSFTIGNTGQTSAPAGQVVTIREQLPAGVTYVSAVAGTGVSAVSCTGTAPALVCSATLSAALPTNGSANFTLNTTAPSASGSITNYASIDPTGGTNPPAPGAACSPASSCTSASTTVNTPMSLTATKTAPATVVTSSALAYSFTISNTGQTPAAAGQVVTINEQLPAGVAYVSATLGSGVSAVSCTGTAPALVCSVTLSAALPTNGSASFTLNTTAPTSSGSITNYASVDPTGGTNPPAPGAACSPASSCTSASTTVNTPMSLTASKSAPATVVTSSALAYSFTISNTGQTPAAVGQVVTINEQLPVGVTFVSAVAGTGVSAVSCTGTAPTLVCSATLSAALPTNGSATFTLNTTAPSASGAITNYASVDPTGGTNPPAPGAACSPASSCTSASTTVNTPMSLTATKTAPATVVTGQGLAYSFTISNTGQTPAAVGQVVTINEQLPAGVTFVSIVAGTGVSTVSCTGTAPALVCSATLSAALPTNGTATFTLNTTAPTSSGSITNYASVDPTGGSNPPVPGAACSPASSCTSASTTVNTPMSLTVAKSAPATVVTGQGLAYSFTISNTGQTPAAVGQVVTINEQLPAGVTFVSAVAGSGVSAVSCTGTAPTLVCSATLSAALPTNGTATFTLNTTAPTNSGSITNYASVDPTGGTNPPAPGAACLPASSCTSASTTVNTAMNLTATKSAPATVVTGQSLTYSFTIGNTGGTSAAVGQVVTISEQLPTGVTYVNAISGAGVSAVSCAGAAPALVCSVTLSTALPTNGSAGFTLNTTAPATAGAIVNYASIDPTGGANPPAPGAACAPVSSCTSAPTTVNTPMSLTATKSAPASVVTGQSLAYSFTISNTGQTPAAVGQVVTINEQLPTGVSYVGAIAGTGVSTVSCTGTAPALVCTATLGTTLPTNGIASFTLSTTAPTSTGAITNYASVDPTGGTNPPTPGATCAPASSCTSASTTVNTPASIQVLKTNNVTDVTAGSVTTYTVTITNTGGTPVSGLTWVDKPSAGLTLQSITAKTATGGNVAGICTLSPAECTGINVDANGGSVSYTVTALVSATAAGTKVTNTASVSGSADCTIALPCSGDDTDNVITPANVALTKTGAASALSGSSYTYTLTLTNSGQTPTGTNLIVKDQLPAGVVATAVSSAATCGPLPSPAGALLTCTVAGPVAANNGTVSFTMTVTLPTVTVATALTNYASSNVSGSGTPVDPTTSGSGCTSDATTTCAKASTTVAPVVLPEAVVSKTNNATSVTEGGTTTYTITVTNPHATDITGVSMVESVVAGLKDVQIVSSSATNGSNAGTCAALTCSGITLKAGGSVIYTVTATVSGKAGSYAENTATVQGGACFAKATCSSTDRDLIVSAPSADVYPVPVDSRTMLVLLSLALAAIAFGAGRIRRFKPTSKG